MSIFFTDTDCEMSYVDSDALGMKVIGMPYTINNQEYVYDFGNSQTNNSETFSMASQ